MATKQVEWILVIRHGKTDHARIYGRLGGETYTGDFIQLTTPVLADLEKVFPDFAGKESVPIVFKWPSGEQGGSLERESADRPHLKWDYEKAPPPWKMALQPTTETVETIPGDPTHRTVQQANSEFANLELSQFGQPFLIAVKLRGESNTLHLRVLVESPKAGFEWADMARAPVEVRDLAARTNKSRGKSWRLFSRDADARPLFFDPDKKVDPWSETKRTVRRGLSSGAESSEDEKYFNWDGDHLAEALEFDFEEVEKFQASINDKSFEVADTEGISKTRGSAQQAFARMVKDNYGWRCALTGISSPEFLIASHIVPWRADKTIRLDPANGICLSILIDRAFEYGFLVVHDDLKVSVDWDKAADDPGLRELLGPYDGAELASPSSAAPNVEYLRRRRELMAGSLE